MGGGGEPPQKCFTLGPTAPTSGPSLCFTYLNLVILSNLNLGVVHEKEHCGILAAVSRAHSLDSCKGQV